MSKQGNLLKQTRWIPVNERLPEEKGKLLQLRVLSSLCREDRGGE